MKVCPPAVIVLVLELVVVFAARTYVIVPDAVPLAPDGIVIHEAFGVAFQGQPVPVVSAIALVMLAAPRLALVGDKE